MALVPAAQPEMESLAQNTFASNQQILMRQGKIDETTSEFVSFKRQNITKWGGLSYLMQ